MECIAIINQKGGVGKTATAANLGAALAQRGQRLLLIDMDPQGHLTTHFGMDDEARGAGIYEVLTKELPLRSAIRPYSPTISIVPAQIDLAVAETELVSTVGREMILRDVLASHTWPFDTVLLDCPPSLGVLTLNALTASNRVLIPMQPHFLALQGVGKLFETISLVSQRLNPALSVTGIIMCMHEAGTRLSGEVTADLAEFLSSSHGTPVPWRDARIFETRIRRNIKLAESPSYGQSIFDYAPRSHGAADYLALADEVIVALSGDSNGHPSSDERAVSAASPHPARTMPDSAPLERAAARQPIEPAAAVTRPVAVDNTASLTSTPRIPPSPTEEAGSLES